MFAHMKKTKRALWPGEKKKIQIEKRKREYLGRHLIVEFYGGKIIEEKNQIKKILFEAAKKSNNVPLKFVFQKFKPQGASGVFLLAESHISFHSWPEYEYLAFDIFSCGKKSKPERALNFLKKVFKPKRIEKKLLKRGKIL